MLKKIVTVTALIASMAACTSGPETSDTSGIFTIYSDRDTNQFFYFDRYTGTSYNLIDGLDSNDIIAFGYALDNVNACGGYPSEYGCDSFMVDYDLELIEGMIK